MYEKQALVFAFILSACYLIISIPFVQSYAIGDFSGTKISLAKLEPELHIIDDIKPLKCDSSGLFEFRVYVENAPEFTIKSIKARVADLSRGDTVYDVSSAVSCNPLTDVISNQEITCRVSVSEMLNKIPVCPMDSLESRFYVTFETESFGRISEATDSRPFVLADQTAEPSLDVDFYIASPPYPVPDINCRTGSEIDVPVAVYHSEVLSGEFDWSFSVGGSSAYSGSLIQCVKIPPSKNVDGGRRDIYICTLTVGSSSFDECSGGAETAVRITLENSGYRISDEFSAMMVDEDLDLGMRISGPGNLECQIIDEDGTCVPKVPAHNLTVTISGNVPPNLEAFDFRYKLGDEDDFTPTVCKKKSSNRYLCPVFITMDDFKTVPEGEASAEQSRQLEIWADVRHLSYYTNITGTIQINMVGKLIDPAINTRNVLNKGKGILDDLDNVRTGLMKAMKMINMISHCCGGSTLASSWSTMTIVPKMVMLAEVVTGRKIWDFKDSATANIINLIKDRGPDVLQCMLERGKQQIEEEIKNLEKFEGGEITNELKIPSAWDYFMNAPAMGCMAKKSWAGLGLDRLIVIACFMFIKIIPNMVGKIITALCAAIKNTVLKNVMSALNVVVSFHTLFSAVTAYQEAQKAIMLARERMNAQLKAQQALADYMDYFQGTMETTINMMNTNLVESLVITPPYETVHMKFISGRSGILNDGDEICKGDLLTIEYDFEKLNQTGNFHSRLSISPAGKTLNFGDQLKGKYGPMLIETVLGADEYSESEIHTFTLSYQNRKFDYRLMYINTPCGD